MTSWRCLHDRLLEKAYGRDTIEELYQAMDHFLAHDPGPIAQVRLPEREDVKEVN